MYETALGVGIAAGPLLGGVLGEVSWRGPFFGVAALMAIALIATVVLVEKTPKPPEDRAVRAAAGAAAPRPADPVADRALLQLGLLHRPRVRAVPMDLSPIKLGLVFTCWGVLVAIFAVFGAPRLQAGSAWPRPCT